MIRRIRKLKKRARKGSTLVEFAIAAPVLFTVIFGAIEFTRLCIYRNLCQDAAYEAARYTMVEGATTAEAEAKALSVVNILGAREVEVVINDGDGITSTSDYVKVYVEMPMAENAFFTPFVYGDRVIGAEIQLKTERYQGYFDPDDVN